jgi:hypothetical protein
MSGPRKRSPLGKWLWDNYATLEQARLDAGGRMNWIGATEELNRQGVRAVGGRLLKVESVRKAWNRVAAAKRQAEAPRPTKTAQAPAKRSVDEILANRAVEEGRPAALQAPEPPAKRSSAEILAAHGYRLEDTRVTAYGERVLSGTRSLSERAADLASRAKATSGRKTEEPK